MQNKVLLDANIIIRFFEGSRAKHFEEAVAIMKAIEEGRMEAVLLDFIVAEIAYVARRVYHREKAEIADVLRQIIYMKHIHIENQPIVLEALQIYVRNNIDFADAMLCAKKQLEGYEVASFDKKVLEC